MESSENFLVVGDCSDRFEEWIKNLLKKTAPIIRKMGVSLSAFQILLFRDPESVQAVKSHLILSEEKFEELKERIFEYWRRNECAIFSFLRIICLQECKDEPIDAGTLLEEIGHFKLGVDLSPSYFLFPERFSEKELLRRGIASAIHHYYVFKLIKECGGGKYIEERKISNDAIQHILQTQSIEFLREKPKFCQILILPILELLGFVDETWKKKLKPKLLDFFQELNGIFRVLLAYEKARPDLDEFWGDYKDKLEYDNLQEMVQIIEEDLVNVYEKYFHQKFAE